MLRRCSRTRPFYERHRDGPLALSAQIPGGPRSPRNSARDLSVARVVLPMRRTRGCGLASRSPVRRGAKSVGIRERTGQRSALRDGASQRTAGGPKSTFVSPRPIFLRPSGGSGHLLRHHRGEHDQQLDDFIAARREGPWPSEATCRAARWQVARFLSYLEQQDVALGDVEPRHVDAYFQHMAPRWSRASLRTSAKMLRSWFAHCEGRGWAKTRPGGGDPAAADLPAGRPAARTDLGRGRPDARQDGGG